jgi:UDP-GlcNAc3NAcA epimerase
MPDVLTIVSTCSQFVKATTLSRAFTKNKAIRERIVHTGQHFDANMSDTFFDELSIPKPAHNLGVGGGSHGAMTARMMEGLETIMQEEKPDRVLVYGDTNSTLAGALVAAKLHIPVIHVEAGLRSFNKKMPEEVNRVLTDHFSDLLLCPTRSSITNLGNEGITEGAHHVGDVMYDATLFAIEQAKTRSYILATIHRAENCDNDDQLRRVIDFLEKEAAGRTIVLPLHPRTKQAIARIGIGEDDLTARGIRTIPPVGYIDMHRLLAGAELVLTDSGGLQKEAHFHRTPCVTLRGETEWVETLEASWNRLWTSEFAPERKNISDYGEGDAAERCIAAILAI